MNHKITTFVLLMLAIPNIAHGQLITQYSAFSNWIFVVIIAVMASLSIAAVYYMIGAVLNNQRVKAGAQTQFIWSVGTVIIIVVVILVLNYFGSIISLPQFFPPSQILTVCKQLGWPSVSVNPNGKPEGQAQGGPLIDLLNAGVEVGSGGNTNAYVKSAPSGGGAADSGYILEPARNICSNLIYPESNVGPQTLTTNIDYGLGATYVLVDNLTNQSATQLNDLYDFENLIYFLRTYKVIYSYCQPVTCAIPIPIPQTLGDFEYKFSVSVNYFDGYVIGRLLTPTVTMSLNLMLYLYMLQLLGILSMLLLWPYLLGAGLILHAFPYTRRTGGFLIALVIVSLLVYPTITMFQYNSLNKVSNLQPTPQYNPSAANPQVLGPTAIPNLALCGRSYQYPGYDADTAMYSVSKFTAQAVFWALTTQAVGIAGGGAASTFFQKFSGQTPNYNTLNGVFCYTAADTLPASYIFKNQVPDGITSEFKKNNEIIPACPDGQGFSSSQTCYVKKTINFYVFPRTRDIINLYSYWPGDFTTTDKKSAAPGSKTSCSGILGDYCSVPEGIIPTEFLIALHDIIPTQGGVTLLAALNNGFGGSGTYFPSGWPFPIEPVYISNTYLALQNLYGIIAVPGYIIPIIDILILISATTGLSSLLGGESEIVGLSRFI